MSKLPTAREVFKSTLDELGFSGYKPSQMTNSDYWLCTCTAIESHTAAHTDALDKYNSLLIEEKKVLQARVKKLESLMQEFVDRVDRGEVRSKKTYAKFKEALK